MMHVQSLELKTLVPTLSDAIARMVAPCIVEDVHRKVALYLSWQVASTMRLRAPDCVHTHTQIEPNPSRPRKFPECYTPETLSQALIH